MVTLEEGSWECLEREKSLSSRSSVHPRRKVLMQTVRLAPHPGRRSEHLESLPPAPEGSCPVLGGAGPARSSSPRRTRLKPLKAGRPRSRGSLPETLHPQPESCISAGASGLGTKSRNPKDRSLPPFSFQDLHVLFRLQFSEKKTVGL